MKEEKKSIEIFEARYKQAINSNAIGFTLSGIRQNDAIVARLDELQNAGARIQAGSPTVVYF